MTRLLVSLVLLLAARTADAGTKYAGPGGYATIQAAVDAAVAGDTIWLYPQTWIESVRISKRLTIQRYPYVTGTATIIGTSAGAFVVDLHDGESFTARDLTLIGNQGPVVRGPSWITHAPYISLERVTTFNGTMGFFGFASLRLRTCRFYSPSSYGIYVLGGVDFDDVLVHHSGGAGIVVNSRDTSSLDWIRNSKIVSSGGPGIKLVGSQYGGFVVQAVEIDYAIGAGIYLDHSDDAHLDDVIVSGTRAGSSTTDGVGDGIMVVKSVDVNVRGASIVDSYRAGISAFGCVAPDRPAQVNLAYTDLIGNSIQLNTDPWMSCAVDATIDDLGANRCVDEDGTEQVCEVLSSKLMPPEFTALPPPPSP